jgi:hypothetical protein
MYFFKHTWRTKLAVYMQVPYQNRNHFVINRLDDSGAAFPRQV